MVRILFATILLLLSGCALNVLESTSYNAETGERTVKRFSNSLCGSSVIEESNIGVFVAKYGSFNDSGVLSVWVYNNNETDQLIKLTAIGKRSIKNRNIAAVLVQAGQSSELLRDSIRLGMYTASHSIQLDLSIGVLNVETSIELEREELTGYWAGALDACQPPDLLNQDLS